MFERQLKHPFVRARRAAIGTRNARMNDFLRYAQEFAHPWHQFIHSTFQHSSLDIRHSTFEISPMTIVACSSAQPLISSDARAGDLSRAIVRLSGPQAFTYAATVFQIDADATKLQSGTRWRRVPGRVSWLTHTLPAHAYMMPSPHSYTRENVIELHLPALPWLVSAVLEKLLAAGARLAQPGEFTRRAFENGRITLDQAQAIGALIQAQTADEALAYAAKVQATPQTQLTRLRTDIEDLLSLVELGLDFSQEDVGVLSPEEMLQRLARLRDRAIALATSSKDENTAGNPSLNSAELNTALPRVVLAGPVNAGKSSLFNTLLHRDAAIVNAAAHTTRDAVEARLALPSGSCVLSDTAGFDQLLSESSSDLQRAGCEASRQALARAHVVLVVLDGSRPPDEQTLATVRAALSGSHPAHAALIWTKADLPENDSPVRFEILALASELLRLESIAQLKVSAQTGAGLPALNDFLSAALEKLGSRHADAVLTAGASGMAAVRTAAAALERAHSGLAAGHGEDIVAVELREALHAFWQTEGVRVRHDAITESMLDRIFATFCIGK